MSAGNYSDAISIPAASASSRDAAQAATARAVYSGSLLRGILPPGDALNALTVGATHRDGLGPIDIPDTAWDLIDAGAPSLFSATGPGVDRSVKPDIHHRGGRQLYSRPVVQDETDVASIDPAATSAAGPGIRVAAPDRGGATSGTAFSAGTSNATALVTREASRLFDVLERGPEDDEDAEFPDGQYHPLLVRALLAHASSWGAWDARLRSGLGLDPKDARRRLTALLGYGALNEDQLGVASPSRAVIVAGGSIARDKRHTYHVPLPSSLRARAEWHRVTITLASLPPTQGTLVRYRGAKVYFATPDTRSLAGDRIEAEHNSVRRGSLQHEIIDGRRAMAFGENATFPIHIECMSDAELLRAGRTVRYALVVSIQTAPETSTTIHDEVQARLRAAVQERARSRVAAASRPASSR